MDNYICINGKKAELTEEQLKKLGIELHNVNPFTRAKKGAKYFRIMQDGAVDWYYENIDEFDRGCFNAANYCTDKSLMEQRALYEILNRQLWRYSMEHDGDKIDWDRDGEKYYIFYNTGSKDWFIGSICHSWDFAVFFYSLEIAKNAIKEVVIPFVKENPEFYEYIYGEGNK